MQTVFCNISDIYRGAFADCARTIRGNGIIAYSDKHETASQAKVRGASPRAGVLQCRHFTMLMRASVLFVLAATPPFAAHVDVSTPIGKSRQGSKLDIAGKTLRRDHSRGSSDVCIYNNACLIRRAMAAHACRSPASICKRDCRSVCDR